MSYPLRDLRALQTEQLIAEHDRHAQNTVVGVQYYLDELARRDMAAAMDEATATNKLAAEAARQAALDSSQVRKLTVVITVLTAVNAVAALVLLGVEIL